MTLRRKKVAIALLLWLFLRRRLRNRRRRSPRIPIVTGTQQTLQIMEQYTRKEFLYETRMNLECFDHFVNELERMGLQSSKTITTEEKAIVFMRALAGKDIQESATKFSRSVSTIHNVLHEVADIVVQNVHVFIVPFVAETHAKISDDTRFADYFHHCVGAVDGSHIPVHVPATECAPFRNRKGYLSMNVCAIVDFNCLFTHVNVGWSGGASDPQVFNDSLAKGLTIPEGTYLLADAGYGLDEKLLTPYRGTRYHLKDAVIDAGRYAPMHKNYSTCVIPV